MAEIAAIFVSLINPAIELGKVIVSPIKHQFNYLCCFTSNIQSLKDEAEKLKNERDGLQMRVNTANRNIEVIVPKVNEWLDASNQIQAKTSGMEVEIENVKSGCFAMKSRFFLSEKVRKTAKAMKKLRKSCNFEEISVPALPASMAPIPQGPSDEFESRKQIEEEIMEDLRGRKVHMMGICGMGGIGKTTMAKRIMSRVREEKLFEEVVMVVISQEVCMSQIQREIADNLGLNLQEESLSVRACKLRARLMGGKRILLILDDIWGRLNLEDLGIPCKSDLEEGCTIILTSRNREVFSEMNAKSYAVQILSVEDAWFLFKGKIGKCVDDLDLLSMPQELAKECKGLPLALVTIGAALKDKSIEHWKVALRKLRSSNPNIPKVLEEVYKPIKVSYDFLDNPDARSLFLLCCLFPEDHNIDVEYLTMYGMGLRIFTDEIRTLEEARDSIRVLLDMLRSCFLLLDGRDKNHVKMHDVVRDVAIFIASEKGLVDRSLSLRDSSINCKWISLVGEEINKLPTRLSFPSLGLLLIDNYSTEHEIRIDFCFFQRMEELNVLSFGCVPFRSLPETTQLLKKLRTLSLSGCGSLDTISIVGELLSLETLICRYCWMIAELPVEIGRLKRLKLLEISKCFGLKRIAPGVISNLVQLEELIVKNFGKWETKANGEQRENAALCELEHLKNLTRLKIEIEDATLAAEEICLPSNIVKYDIELGEAEYQCAMVGKFYERSMYLNSKKDITFGKWFYLFIRSTEYLHAQGDHANNLDIAQAQKMKELDYTFCSTVNKLVNITPSMDLRVGVFPHLEFLGLRYLDNLEEICDGPIPKLSNSFGNLKLLHLADLPALRQIWKSPHQNVSLCNLSSIFVYRCIKLRKLFPLRIARDGLLQLENLDIGVCSMMEQVFSNEENEKDGEQCDRITFPKLKSLKLLDLPSLITFCKGSESIDFPLLETISIEGCRKLKSLLSCNWNNLNSAGNDDSFHVFCNQKVIFGSLKDITIEYYHGIRSLFSSSIAVNLVNVKTLRISKCKEMVKVIEDDEEMLCEKPYLLFPSLLYLYLENLPKLESFCSWRCDFQLPSLELVDIKQCPLFEQFSSIGSVATPNLKSIEMDCKSKDVGDLNSVIQLHFNAESKKEKEKRKAYGRLENQLQLKQKGMEADNEKIEIEEVKINEESTSGQSTDAETDHETGEIEDEEINEEST